MDRSQTLTGEPLRALMEDLLAQERGVDVVYSPALSEVCLHVRVGLKAVTDEALGLEHPLLDGRPAELQTGTGLVVGIGLSGSGSGTFETVVLGPWPGDRFSGPVLAVAAPRELALGQRRAAFRVAIASATAVALVPADGRGRGCMGTLADLSDTGCGVWLDPAGASTLHPGTDYRVLFRLPDDPSVNLELPARLARQPLKVEPEGLHVGLCWTDPSTGRRDPDRSALARFIVREQLAHRRRWVR